ncbi:MAG TPA: hypothetical protein VK806_06280 [Bacteroidia bacterium]|jgi:hypothetical protein|nr:hypothetical protein [Bacteroidia bacterium]
MGDYVGLIWLGKMGTFVRWLLNGCKGKYNQFYEETHKEWFLFIDYFLGVGLFFGIMVIWVTFF